MAELERRGIPHTVRWEVEPGCGSPPWMDAPFGRRLAPSWPCSRRLRRRRVLRPHDPVRLADAHRRAGRERPVHDRLGGLATPDLALHLRDEPGRLGRPLAGPAARAARRQPLDGVQLGDERLERRRRLPPPERRLPRRRRRARARPCGPHVAAAHAAGASMIVTVPMAGYVSADKAPERRRQPDPGLPERPLPRVPRRASAAASPTRRTRATASCTRTSSWPGSSRPSPTRAATPRARSSTRSTTSPTSGPRPIPASARPAR